MIADKKIQMAILIMSLLIPAAYAYAQEAGLKQPQQNLANPKKLKKPAPARQLKVVKFNTGDEERRALIRENILLQRRLQISYGKIDKVKREANVLLKREKEQLFFRIDKLKDQNTQLEREIRMLKSRLKPVKELKQKLSLAYEDLGTAYANVKKYNMAIDAYEESLNYDFQNPRAHYNLGILYQHSQNETEKAIYHLKLYLKLNPKARDGKEVGYLIKTLSQIVDEERFTTINQ